MPDEAQKILAPLQVDNSVKADAWEAFNKSANESEFTAKLQSINLPQNVKADLWEAKRGAKPKIEIPNVVQQAQKVISNIPQFTSPADQLRGQLANAQTGTGPAAQKYNEYQRQSGSFAGTAVGTMATGGLLPAIKGGGLAINALRLGGRALASGAGAGGGALAGGATPEEAGVTAIGGVVGQPIAEGVGAGLGVIGKQLAKFKGLAPEELNVLRGLPDKELAIRQTLEVGKSAARKAASAAYDLGITTPVDMAPAQRVAQQVADQILAHPVPSGVARMADMGGASQLTVSGITDDMQLILKKIVTSNKMSFNEAQQHSSALGEEIAAGFGKLPGEVFHSLKAVKDTIDLQKGLAAQAEGKLPQYQLAQSGWRQYMQDFNNTGAPMKSLMSGAARKDFSVLKQLVGDNGGKIAETMDKYGIPADEVRAFQAMGKAKALRSISQSAELKRMGEPAFQQLMGQAAKEQAKKAAFMVGKKTLPYAASAAGGGTALGLYEHFRKKP